MGFIYVIFIYIKYFSGWFIFISRQILFRMVGKVCIIGGGPSGLGVLCWFAKLKREGKVRNGNFFGSFGFVCETEKREGKVRNEKFWFRFLAKVKREGKVSKVFGFELGMKETLSVSSSPHLNPKCFCFRKFWIGLGCSTITSQQHRLIK